MNARSNSVIRAFYRILIAAESTNFYSPSYSYLVIRTLLSSYLFSHHSLHGELPVSRNSGWYRVSKVAEICSVRALCDEVFDDRLTLLDRSVIVIGCFSDHRVALVQLPQRIDIVILCMDGVADDLRQVGI
jgi:hypothetical protein